MYSERAKKDVGMLQDDDLHAFVGRDEAIRDVVTGYINLNDAYTRCKALFCATGGAPGVGKTWFIQELVKKLCLQKGENALRAYLKRIGLTGTLAETAMEKLSDVIPLLITFNTSMSITDNETKENILLGTATRIVSSSSAKETKSLAQS